MGEKNKPPAAGIANENFLKSSRNFGHYKLKTPEELQAKVDAYFSECDNHTKKALVGTGANAVVKRVPDPRPYTWIGLARAVGLEGRQSLLNYVERDGYGEILMKARLKIEQQWEEALHRPANNRGVMFNLTNNTIGANRYKDKQEFDLGGQKDNPIEVKKEIDYKNLPLEALLEIEKIILAAEKENNDD